VEVLVGGIVELKGPDLEKGVPIADVAEGKMLLGHARGEPVFLTRRGLQMFAVGAVCTHYGAPLSDGVLVGDKVRCPMHHACFNLRTGQPTAPAFQPIACWKVEERGPDVFVTAKLPPAATPTPSTQPKRVVIIGGGAAGHAAAEALRRGGHGGSITLLTADSSAPYDRTNVSKDYLAGTAPEEWMPMRPLESYVADHVDLRINAKVTSIDTSARAVLVDGGESVPFDALLVATGADPIRLSVPGADLPHVFYVRSLADSRAIIARSRDVKRAVVIGASFIGLEAAASLRARNIDVQVVAPDAPLIRVLGAEVSDFIRKLHEDHGVGFHIGPTAVSVTADAVVLSDGTSIPADLVIVGIGVRPALSLAQAAGLTIDRGVVVNEHMETSVAGIYAAGDIARWPDPRTGRTLRVEHWVVAQRQAQVAARNMLGHRTPYQGVPFFWSQHYDVAINYVGYVEKVEAIERVGRLEDRNCMLAYREAGRIAAVATIGRDQASLHAEEMLSREDQPGLEALLRG
jgi:NADPH-dependent 2,4-dienoyl-CoA reductase/sulfur reductase-like enzyme/nitrite reductase/ring-hydroxylating ferredoxin subunit